MKVHEGKAALKRQIYNGIARLKSARWLAAKLNHSQMAHYNQIKISGLFDRAYYETGLSRLGIELPIRDPISHYLMDGDKLHISPNPLFDCEYYLETYPDVVQDSISALAHYIIHGWKEGRNPHPLFDSRHVSDQLDSPENPIRGYICAVPGTINPHPLFDEHYVLEQLNRDGRTTRNALIEFLKTDKTYINPNRSFDSTEYARSYPDIGNQNPFYHYLRFGKREGRVSVSTEGSLHSVESQIQLAATLDCDVLAPDVNLESLRKYRSIETSPQSSRLLAHLLSRCGDDIFDLVVFIPHFVLGGAEKVLAHFLSAALNSESFKIAVLMTDSDNAEALDWLPRSKNLKFIRAYKYMSEIESSQLTLVIGVFLQLIRPRNILVSNSLVGWNLIERHGAALSHFAKLHCFAFCYDYDDFRRRSGYAWTHLPRCFQYMTTVISDNTKTVEEFANNMYVDAKSRSKFLTLKQPAEKLISKPSNRLKISSARAVSLARTVLWAGRFHRQKNLECAMRVARSMKHLNFVFAGGFSDDPHVSESLIAENMTFIGPYSGFESIPFRDCDVFLHTADWDGLPNVLLEAAGAGLPIIARDVGGVSDLVRDTTGWLLSSLATDDEFKVAIELVLSADRLTRQKVDNMYALLEKEHGQESTIRAAENILGKYFK